ncbi:MAG: hypothetical protein AAF762_11370 [Pseudomonadota bacterium]
MASPPATVFWPRHRLGYSFSLIERSIDDSYARTLIIDFMNTLFVGFISIIFAATLGFVVGTMRDSRNLGLATASAGWTRCRKG